MLPSQKAQTENEMLTLQTRVETRKLGTQTFDVCDKGIDGVWTSARSNADSHTLPEFSDTESFGSRRSLVFTNVPDKVSDELLLLC